MPLFRIPGTSEIINLAEGDLCRDDFPCHDAWEEESPWSHHVPWDDSPLDPLPGTRNAPFSPRIDGRPKLRRGSRGRAVMWLQKRIKAATGWPRRVDGHFGFFTEVAVKRAQQELGLAPDGVVGPETWVALAPDTPSVGTGRWDELYPASNKAVPPPKPPKPPPELTPIAKPVYLKVDLVDRFGNPCKKQVSYTVVDSAGTQTQGPFSRGVADVEPVAEGTCRLKLDGLPPGSVSLRKPPPPPNGWLRLDVELRVWDDRGCPLANAPFEVEFYSGQRIKGQLDEGGYALVTDPISERFKVTVPEYDPLNYDQIGAPTVLPEGRLVHASPRLLAKGVRGQSGRLTPIVVHHPKHTLVRAETAVFRSGSSFPGMGLVSALPGMVDALDAHEPGKLMCFGHTDAEGSEDANKRESDLRATALHALLTSDLDAFDDLAEKDGWDLLEYQELLTALGCAMPIDGRPGPKTQAGTKTFQDRHNAGDFSPRNEGKASPPSPSLTVDGKPGPKTRAALRTAYLHEFGQRLPAERFFATPKAGCSEFNRIGEPPRDRRVSLALLGDKTSPASAPCKEGDAGACPVDEVEGVRCRFYGRWFEAERLTRRPARHP